MYICLSIHGDESNIQPNVARVHSKLTKICTFVTSKSPEFSPESKKSTPTTPKYTPDDPDKDEDGEIGDVEPE